MSQTVLIVEDEQRTQRLLAQTLEFNGYSTLLADNGKAALTILEKTPPDLILLDYMMPVMDGRAFILEVDRQNLRDSIPILLMTAASYAKTRAQEIGADGYINKPFEVTRLFQTIERYLKPQS